MLINHWPLPPLLLDLIQENRWKVPEKADLKDWERILNHGGLSFDEPPQVKLFQFAEMEEKTKLLSETLFPLKLDPTWSGSVSRNKDNPPLAVAPRYSLVIADLYHVPEQPQLLGVPIVLDFRKYANDPRVIYYPDDAFELYWCEIAASFAELALALHL